MVTSIFRLFSPLFGRSRKTKVDEAPGQSEPDIESPKPVVADSPSKPTEHSSSAAGMSFTATSEVPSGGPCLQEHPMIEEVREATAGFAERPSATRNSPINPTGRLPGSEPESHQSDLLDATVMLVDDEPTTLDVLQAFLEDAGYRNFVTTCRSHEAMGLIESEKPDIVLTDLNMPDVTGFDILAAMRAHPECQHIPAIMLTSDHTSETKLKALKLGATDFLAKPVDPSELALRLRNTLAAKAYQDRLTFYDVLTGLPNRRLFLDRLEMALQFASREQKMGAVLHVNLDRFKQINDTLGHSAGDMLLKMVANRLEESLRQSDSVGRLGRDQLQVNLSRVGGDEFTLLLPHILRPLNAAHVARRIQSILGQPLQVDDHELFITASIGIAIFPSDGDNVEALLKHADIAVHHAKEKGGNTQVFYAEDINTQSLERLSLENQLRRALERDELVVYYQPKVDVKTGKIVGAEGLVRWQHPDRGLVPPAKFIPLAEETGLIVPLGEWVLNAVCQQSKSWVDQGLPQLSLAVNVSSQQFRDQHFSRVLFRALAGSGLAPQYLTIELTESMVMDNAKENVDVLRHLKSIGVKLSIDDFGTGYSALSYLDQFPLDELKVDQSFMRPIQAASDDAPIVSAIIAMAHSLGLTVVTEGVETGHQLAFLQAHGCDVYQGYLFSKPVSAAEFEALLRAENTGLKGTAESVPLTPA